MNRLLCEFNDYKDVAINSSHFDKIISNRKLIPYDKALNIAKMLILNYSPDLNSGSENMLTLLFDMNKLWEEYIYRILQNNKPTGFKVNFQNKTDFWENKTIRPDIVITSDKEDIFVIDTKWKIIDANKPSDDDLKQMFAYNLHWKAEKSMLLYPKTTQTDSDFGEYHFDRLEKKCKLGFVSVLENGRLIKSADLSNEILRKFEIRE